LGSVYSLSFAMPFNSAECMHGIIPAHLFYVLDGGRPPTKKRDF
jgi:hypothetical protein